MPKNMGKRSTAKRKDAGSIEIRAKAQQQRGKMPPKVWVGSQHQRGKMLEV